MTRPEVERRLAELLPRISPADYSRVLAAVEEYLPAAHEGMFARHAELDDNDADASVTPWTREDVTLAARGLRWPRVELGDDGSSRTRTRGGRRSTERTPRSRRTGRRPAWRSSRARHGAGRGRSTR